MSKPCPDLELALIDLHRRTDYGFRPPTAPLIRRQLQAPRALPEAQTPYPLPALVHAPRALIRAKQKKKPGKG